MVPAISAASDKAPQRGEPAPSTVNIYLSKAEETVFALLGTRYLGFVILPFEGKLKVFALAERLPSSSLCFLLLIRVPITSVLGHLSAQQKTQQTQIS